MYNIYIYIDMYVYIYIHLLVCIVNGVKLNRLSLITWEPTKMRIGLVSELLLNHEIG